MAASISSQRPRVLSPCWLLGLEQAMARYRSSLTPQFYYELPRPHRAILSLALVLARPGCCTCGGSALALAEKWLLAV